MAPKPVALLEGYAPEGRDFLILTGPPSAVLVRNTNAGSWPPVVNHAVMRQMAG